MYKIVIISTKYAVLAGKFPEIKNMDGWNSIIA
jgi:hypothetical protein